MKAKLFAMALALTTLLGAQHAEGCSRVLYVGSDSLRIVGRSLDWKTPIPTNIYVYPRGIKKSRQLSARICGMDFEIRLCLRRKL